MKTYLLYDGKDYLGQIICESVYIEPANETIPERYLFNQGSCSTIIRTKNNIKVIEEA